ncbi:hypothetical protein [Mycobacterium shinjukuense]|uniref:hypothetical protein n=1 Tax=Mycobacterium shinjukuense TaxID=398694 RepID=UPI0035566B81
MPLLKNPDDGKVVELKKPGAAAILMRVMSTGPSPPVPTMLITVEPSGLPTLRLTEGLAKLNEMLEKEMGPISPATLPPKSSLRPL